MSQSEHDLRVDYVEFGAQDLSAVKAFYAGVFGWRFTDYGPDYTAFEDGRLSGGFTPTRESGRGGALVVMYANDLEGTEAKVKAAGGRIMKAIFSFPGGRRFHFEDPAGNELAVWSDR
jgi:predicted enzyme related to lactoylglutathione lyase